MLAGTDGVGGIVFDNYALAYLVGNLALAVILLDGGLRTQVKSFRRGPLAVPVAGHPGRAADLRADRPGSHLAIRPALAGRPADRRHRRLDRCRCGILYWVARGLTSESAPLEIESGSNDPMAVFLTVTLIAMLASGQDHFDLSVAAQLLWQFGLGAALGLGGGWLLLQLVNRLSLASGLYPLLTVSGGLALFAITNALGGSGFLAIYLCGLLLGNLPIRSRHGILHMLDGLAWLAQIGMFLVLGLLVTPHELLPIALPALALALWMPWWRAHLGLPRLLPFRAFHDREKAFIAWVGLRGAVPIILAVFFADGRPGERPVVLQPGVLHCTGLPLAARYQPALGGTPGQSHRPPSQRPSRARDWRYTPPASGNCLSTASARKWCIGAPLRALMMPEGTRVAALFRQRQLLHPLGSTTLRPATYSAWSAMNTICRHWANCSASHPSAARTCASLATSFSKAKPNLAQLPSCMACPWVKKRAQSRAWPTSCSGKLAAPR